MILDWLERYKDEGNCDMKVYWMKWSMNVMKLTEWKQSDWTQLKLWKECQRNELWKAGGKNDMNAESRTSSRREWSHRNQSISHSFHETKWNEEWNWMINGAERPKGNGATLTPIQPAFHSLCVNERNERGLNGREGWSDHGSLRSVLMKSIPPVFVRSFLHSID